MSFKIKTKGDFKNTETFLLSHKESAFTMDQIIDIANESLKIFKYNTPVESGKTAESWRYEINKINGEYIIDFHNDNIQNGINIAILVDSGHATSDGRWIAGKHYIDQTIKDIFKYINKIK